MTVSGSACPKPPVLIYRDHLLSQSEAFVIGQGESLQYYRAWYAGSKRVPGIYPPPERTYLVNSGRPFGRAAEAVFKITGLTPGLLRLVRRLGPKLMHAHFGPDGTLVLPTARHLGVPLVVTFHGFDATMDDE